MGNSPRVAALATLGLAWTAMAQNHFAKTCPYDGVCYQLNIPDSTAKTGQGDVFFQIRASIDYQWAALGQGSGMRGANIFVMYESSDGKNVTVSPRYGVGEEEPLWDSRADIELLSGSGVEDGYMTANIRCGDCDRWAAGYMDFTADKADWIWGARLGRPLRSNDVEVRLAKHDESRVMPWSLANAKGGNSANPFNDGSAAVINQGAGVIGEEGESTGWFGFPGETRARLHGGLATLAFVILFPLGGILIRLANFRGGIWIHVIVQIIAWLMALAAMGLGIRMAVDTKALVNAHPIIGIVLLALLIGQPIYGLLHHRRFKQSGQRGVLSYAHLSIGRIVVFGGMVNGGLGIMLAGDVPQRAIIIYSVVAAVLALLYILAIIWGERRRKNTKMTSTGFRRMDDKAALLSRRGDEGGLAQPQPQGTEMRRLWLNHPEGASTEYAPLSVGEGYGDAPSRPGSRAGSRAPSPSGTGLYDGRRSQSVDARARVSMT